MRTLLAVVTLLLSATSLVHAQAFPEGQPQPESSMQMDSLEFAGEFKLDSLLVLRGEVKGRFVVRPTDTVQVRWEQRFPREELRLKIGRQRANYDPSLEVTLDNAHLVSRRWIQFIPANVGLTAGVYYATVTNSGENTRRDIKNDPEAYYSEELRFAVDGTGLPRVLSPRGEITDSTPLFEWEAVPGVPYYGVVLSSRPITIRKKDDGMYTADGAKITWIVMTEKTSLTYGDYQNFQGRYLDMEIGGFDQPPPLVNGTYNFVVSNVFDKEDPLFVSDRMPTVQEFVYDSGVDPPELLSPADHASFSDSDEALQAPEIEFEWTAADGATYYWVEVLRVGQDGIETRVWEEGTTEPRAVLPARRYLDRGTYRWHVYAYNDEGGGARSEMQTFGYETPMGELIFRPYRVDIVADGDSTRLDTTDVDWTYLQLREQPDGFRKTITNGDALSFAFRGDLPSGRYAAIAYRNQRDILQDTVRFTLEAEGRSVHRPYLRSFASRLTGSVVDADGGSVRAATISIRNEEGQTWYAGMLGNRGSISDASGQFTVELPPGTYSVYASKWGYLNSDTLLVTLSDSTGLDLYLDPLVVREAPSFITGRVLNENGEPVTGVAVSGRQTFHSAYDCSRSSSYPDGGEAVQAVTDSDGLYELELSPGCWAVTASKEGFLTKTPSRDDLFDEVRDDEHRVYLRTDDRREDVDFTLREGANLVTGRVLELVEDGGGDTVPMQQAWVKATPVTGGATDSSFTDAEGRFALFIGQGTYELASFAPGYGPSSPIEMTLEKGQTVRGKEFTHEAFSGAITGRVMRLDSTAIEGAAVRVGNLTRTQDYYEVLTGVDGSYYMEVESTPEPYGISVSKFGFVPPAVTSLPVAADDVVAGVDFFLSENGGGISGTVRSGGNGLSRVRVTAEGTYDVFEALTNDRGRYQLDVTEGTWQVRAAKSGFDSDTTWTVTVQTGQMSAGNDFELTDASAQLSGQVDDGSEGVEGAHVQATPLDAPGKRAEGGDGEALTTQTLSDGTFSLRVPAGTAYEVSVSKAGHRPVLDGSDGSRGKRAATQVTGRLQTGARVVQSYSLPPAPALVSGRVRDEAGDALAGVEVASYLGGVLFDRTTTTVDGRYVLAGDEGDLEVRVAHSGYGHESRPLTLQVGQQLDRVDFALAEQFALLRGRVQDAGGRPVGGAVLVLEGPAGSARAVSGEDGHFLVTRLAEGTYQARVTREGFADTTLADVRVAAGSSSPLAVPLSRMVGRLAGQVTSADGQPVAGATVTARHAAGRRFAAVTDAQGAYTIEPVLLGDYEVQASSAGYTSLARPAVTLTAEVPAAQATVADLVANRSSLAGSVADAATGSPLRDVEVVIKGEAGTARARTAADGTFAIEQVAPGSYTLTAESKTYSSAPAEVTLANDAPVTVDVAVKANDGRLEGTITGSGGSSLPFAAVVKASAADLTYETRTDEAGRFVFDGIAGGRAYTVTTDIYRRGYENATVEVRVPEQEAGRADLEVPVRTSTVSGSVGQPLVNVELRDAATGDLVALARTDAEGAYRFQYQPAGTYRVVPARRGYLFSPVQAQVSVGLGAEASKDFSATSNMGALRVAVQDAEGHRLNGVRVTGASKDRAVTLQAVADTGGVALFTGVEAGRRYVLWAAHEGYSTAEPVEVELRAGDSLAVEVTMAPSTASVAGTVTDGEDRQVRQASVSARRHSTGEVFRATADHQGRYALGSLPAGDYDVAAAATGYRADTVTVSVADGASLAGVDPVLQPLSVRLLGFVYDEDEGVSGATVTATSAVSVQEATNANGRFYFQNLPVSGGEDDTTYYEIRVTGQNLPELRRVVAIPGGRLGGTVKLDDIFVPSGTLDLAVTDGVEPLAGASVSVSLPDGKRSTAVTDERGRIARLSRLAAGSYPVRAEKEGYLRPAGATRGIQLASDTAAVSSSIALPYRHVPVGEVEIGEAVPVRVGFRSDFEPGAATARLFYRRASQAVFQEIELARAEAAFAGELPAVHTEERLTYEVRIFDGDGALAYSTGSLSYQPVAAGVLAELRVQPALEGLALRKGDTYAIELQAFDGLSAPLTAAFADGTGRLTWTSSDEEALEITPVEGGDPTRVRLRGTRTGTFNVQATAHLGGVERRASFSVKIADVPLGALRVSAPDRRVSNTSGGVAFKYATEDTTGSAVHIGSGLAWSVSPSQAGTIDQAGVFVPSDSTFIGPVTVTARDEVSGLEGTAEVDLFARVDGSREYVLYDGTGVGLVLPRGALPFAAEIGVSAPVSTPSQKNVRTRGSTSTFTLSDQMYRFTFRADEALQGDSLLLPALLEMPLDESLRLHEGERGIGFFDDERVQWDLLRASEASSGYLATESMSRFGEYAVLTANEPLGLKHVAVLPSPFSPEVAPLKVGYFLTTLDPPARVSIRIYNVRGELVRILLEDDQQVAGRYGSRTGLREITWDGTTDAGTLARNGRYIIHIEARDNSGKQERLVPVVLVK